MQTFITRVEDFALSAADLDSARLERQIHAARDIIDILKSGKLTDDTHPVLGMWADYIPALQAYGHACLDEWKSRGEKWTARHNFGGKPHRWQYPWWSDCAEVYNSHRSRLNHKWMIDSLRSALPPFGWLNFRSQYCAWLPEKFSQFEPEHREKLRCIMQKRGLESRYPTVKFFTNVGCDCYYIWPQREQGKYRVFMSGTWYDWFPGNPIPEYCW